ncbi:MAG TPA: ABC transporter substrate-binding protein [Candidatus Limnocylindrales bacterium]|nr:ABC transporter substrate-binding protein [Candidatus Limnocylindrales bacterium]
MSPRLRAIGAFMSFALLLAACGGGGQSPTASAPAGASASAGPSEPAPSEPAAELEDTLTVLCTPQEDWCQVMVARFEEDFGVDTNYVRLSSGEALARLQAGAQAPEFSVWWGGPADGFVAANAEGLLEPYVSPNSEMIPAERKDASGVWTGVYVGALGFCSNTTVLGELGVDVPTSWDDLTDPALDDQIAIAHPASSGTAYTALYTQVIRLGGEDAAIEFAQQVHPNILQYTSSGAAPAEMAGRGEVAVSVVFSHDCVRNIEAGFSDLEVSFPEEGTGYEIGGVALIAGAPEPNAAKAWVDWSLEAETQEIGPNEADSFQLPTNPDAAVHEASVNLDEVTLVEYDFQAAGEAREGLTQRFEDEVVAAPVD